MCSLPVETAWRLSASNVTDGPIAAPTDQAHRERQGEPGHHFFRTASAGDFVQEAVYPADDDTAAALRELTGR
jgi:hypothetical protein